jgi:uncharacterized protein (DUF2235 family)
VTPRQKPRLEIGSTNQSKSRELKNQFRRWALRARRVPPSLAGQPGGKTGSATAHRTREWIPAAATEAGLANPIAGLKTRAGETKLDWDGSRERELKPNRRSCRGRGISNQETKTRRALARWAANKAETGDSRSGDNSKDRAERPHGEPVPWLRQNRRNELRATSAQNKKKSGIAVPW